EVFLLVWIGGEIVQFFRGVNVVMLNERRRAGAILFGRFPRREIVAAVGRLAEVDVRRKRKLRMQVENVFPPPIAETPNRVDVPAAVIAVRGENLLAMR